MAEVRMGWNAPTNRKGEFGGNAGRSPLTDLKPKAAGIFGMIFLIRSVFCSVGGSILPSGFGTVGRVSWAEVNCSKFMEDVIFNL